MRAHTQFTMDYLSLIYYFFFDIAGDVVQSQANFDNFLKNKNPIEKWKPHLKSAGMEHQYKLSNIWNINTSCLIYETSIQVDLI